MTASTSMAAPLRRGNASPSGAAFMAVLLGIAMTLVLRGYQFGSGNHAVYLVAPLREVHPELLRKDWWATHTLQYHWAFTQVTAGLMRVHLAGPVFLIFYLALVVLLHVGWLRGVRGIGLDAKAYLLSVVLYYLSAGGVGLGSYQFLQDSSFLPGNVANIAMLWGVVYWIEKRGMAAAMCLAGAGFFHLNHALVGLMFWPLAVVYQRLEKSHGQDARDTSVVVALLQWGVILLAGLPNILPALRATFAGGVKMPLGEFVDLYVHLRHPHHYDPLAWPVALWVSFLWAVPLALAARLPGRAAFALWFFMALQGVALVFAGIFFVSEPLIQMSLFRFSIYAKLIACIGAAGFLFGIARRAPRVSGAVLFSLPWGVVIAILIVRFGWPLSAAGSFAQINLAPLLFFVGLLAVICVCLVQRRISFNRTFAIAASVFIAAMVVAEWQHLGLRLALRDDDDGDYLALCDFVRGHTPVDAVFVVPPNEQVFRYRARRAIVVNFKNVPQLSGEMGEWKERLETVLGEPLSALPRRFDLAHAAMAARYDSRTAAELVEAARRYEAAYVVTTRAIEGWKTVFENAGYHLYAVEALADGDAREGRQDGPGDTAGKTPH